MSAEYYFAAKSIGQSKLGGRKPSTLLAAARHNKRTTGAHLDARGRIDATSSWQNYCIAGATDAEGVVALARSIMAGIGKDPDGMRRDYVQAVEFVFSLPNGADVVHDDYFRRCVEWTGVRFGVGNILAADVHLDEATPHCHVLVAPVEGGRWVGGAQVVRPAMAKLFEAFSKEVAEAYGLKMASRLSGARKAEAVAMVLEAIEKAHRPLIQDALWLPTRAAIERDPGPFLAALGLEPPKAAPVKPRTMAQIFTGRGKGPKREEPKSRPSIPKGFKQQLASPRPSSSGTLRDSTSVQTVRDQAAPKPLGIEIEPENVQSLSCVGIARPKATSRPAKTAQEPLDASGEGEGARTVERDSWGFQDDAQGHADDDVQIVPEDWVPTSTDAGMGADWP